MHNKYMDFANEVKQSFMTFRKANDSPYILLTQKISFSFLFCAIQNRKKVIIY